MDVDVPHRRAQPKLYGYIPDDNGLRGRCFTLMTLISTLHNLSRTLGCAMLAASSQGKMMVVYFIGGEMLLYLIYKVARKDFYYWIRLDGLLSITSSFFIRVCVKITADFR